VLQLASLSGIYGLTFLIGWTASIGALVLAHFEDPARWRGPASALVVVLVAVLIYGSARLSRLDHDVPTVRVASVVVPHERDYHAEILDENSPRAEAPRFQPELRALEDALFHESTTAAAAGSEVVFWAETAAVFYEDHDPAFLDRAAAFARKHRVYLQTAALVLRYDSEMAANRVTLFTPDGNIAYQYLKSQTWYPTESDGVIRSHQTPWGTLSTVICFDLDVPHWMRQAAKLDVDVLLVPGFDTEAISPYHTEAGLFRAVEGGYSLVRGVNAGTSMAVDATGRVLALQDSFRTPQRIMYVDVPTQRRWTLYGAVGDWVPASCALAWIGLIARASRRRRRGQPQTADAHSSPSTSSSSGSRAAAVWGKSGP
jgi:apolipoprotein N-acyltransferase